MVNIFFRIDITQVRILSTCPGFLYLSTHCFQLRAVWVPTQSVCEVLNSEGSKNNVTATLVADVVLLLIMLVGLIRLRLHGNTMFGLGRVLWSQVGSGASRLL